jgi:hypothetical protein
MADIIDTCNICDYCVINFDAKQVVCDTCKKTSYSKFIGRKCYGMQEVEPEEV